MANVNTIIFNEDLTVKSQTSQPIRAYAQQGNTIEIYAPVSGFSTAFIIYQGLKDSVVNPKLRATQQLYMEDKGTENINGVPHQKWQHTVPGQVLNDGSLMQCTGLRIQVALWYTSGDFLGVEYTADADTLAVSYPSATDGQIVRVISTNSDWVYDETEEVWEDFEDFKNVGIVKEPTSSVDFTLERSIYTTEPTSALTNTEYIISELNKKLAKAGDTMTGDLDMDGNDVDNVRFLVLKSASGDANISFNGTDVTVNIGGVEYTCAVKETNGDLDMDDNDIDNVRFLVLKSASSDANIAFNGTDVIVKIGGVEYTYAVKETENTFDEVNTFIKQILAQAGIDVNSAKIVNVANGTNAGDAVNKGQLDLKEKVANKVTEFQATPDDTAYPSEKLVKDNLDLKEDKANKGATNGYTPLVDGIVPSAYIPNAYDNYEEVATYADLPTTGVESTVYVVIADETSGGNTSTYRWTGSVYGKISDVLSASEVKTLYESNANTNAFTNPEKTKLLDLYTQAQLLSALNDRYTKAETDALLDELKAVYGWQSSLIAELDTEGTATALVADVAEYDLVIWQVNTDGEFRSQIFCDDKLSVGDEINITVNTTPTVTAVLEKGATNYTMTISSGTATGCLTGIKMEQQEAVNITYDNSDSDLVATDVKGALDELDSDLATETDERKTKDAELDYRIDTVE